MTDPLIAFFRARLDEVAKAAHAAAAANPGSAATYWSAEQVDYTPETGSRLPRKAWAIVPERVRGIVLAICPADIQPKVVTHIALHDPASVLLDVQADRKLIAKFDEAVAWYEANPAAPAGEVTGLYTAIKIRAQRFDRHEDWQAAWQDRES